MSWRGRIYIGNVTETPTLKNVVIAALDRLERDAVGRVILQQVTELANQPVMLIIGRSDVQSTGGGWREVYGEGRPTAADFRLCPDGTYARRSARREPRAGYGVFVLNLAELRNCASEDAGESIPLAIGIGHELIHFIHMARGEDMTMLPGAGGARNQEEMRTIGLPPYQNEPLSENRLRASFGLPLRTVDALSCPIARMLMPPGR